MPGGLHRTYAGLVKDAAHPASEYSGIQLPAPILMPTMSLALPATSSIHYGDGGPPPGFTEPVVEALAGAVLDALKGRLDIAQRPEPLLTVADVATHLSVSKRTVETLVAEGALAPLRVRGARRFTREAVDAYVRSLAGRKPRRRTARA